MFIDFSLTGGSSSIVKKSLMALDLVHDQLHDESWCSNLSPASKVSGGGLVDGTKVKCMYGNEEVFEFNYNPFVIDEPDCSDASSFFTYEVKVDGNWPTTGVT